MNDQICYRLENAIYSGIFKRDKSGIGVRKDNLWTNFDYCPCCGKRIVMESKKSGSGYLYYFIERDVLS